MGLAPNETGQQTTLAQRSIVGFGLVKTAELVASSGIAPDPMAYEATVLLSHPPASKILNNKGGFGEVGNWGGSRLMRSFAPVGRKITSIHLRNRPLLNP